MHRIHRSALILLTGLLALPFPGLQSPARAQQPGTSGPAAVPTLEHEGAAALGMALRRLGTTKRVLMIAAHPDDENTALLAELALGAGADVAYLSLTRGEGGQNLIGPELQEGLGLIRSEELLAARRLDGARQFFTRAYDFGFARTADETFAHWPRDTILADVVETVRRFRPDIIVSVFSGTPEDGHGHHQAAGLLAREAFDAAADAARFPEQFARGLTAHRAHHLFQSMWRPPPSPDIAVATGALDPLFGRSRHQVSMQSRSRHRSQDMGAAEPSGPQQVALRVLATRHRSEPGSLFAGVDTTLLQHARSAGVGGNAAELLRQYEWIVQQLRSDFNPLRPEALVIPLADATHLLRRVQEQAPRQPRTAALHLALDQELARTGDALRLAAGVVVDVASDRELLVPGDTATVTVTIWNGGRAPVGLQGLRMETPVGWSSRNSGSALPRILRADDVVRLAYQVVLPMDAAPSEAYFLRAARAEGLYAWDVADELRGLPFEPPPLRAVLHMDAGTPFSVQRAAEFVEVDKALGEVRTPLRVVPRASVAVEPRVLAWPAGDTASRVITVNVESATSSSLDGVVRLHVPDGFRVEAAEQPVRLNGRGDAATARFTVSPAPAVNGSAMQRAEFRAEFAAGAETFRRGYTVIDYPHIHPHSLYRDAVVEVSSFPVRIADGLRVGYIEGAGDDGAEALRQLGATVEILDAAALASGDLAQYDAIVAGIRAYEVRRDILTHNERLLQYARGGGTFVVQYNKYELVEDGPFMPFPATMARPHGRITDERAPVTILAPDHPLIAGPNRIIAADFDGWVQERGLYFLDTFDPRYTPLLSITDPGQAPLDGGLVAARVGDGWYVYTGLALFRQLPLGVPGAYRLLANMASLGRQARVNDGR